MITQVSQGKLNEKRNLVWTNGGNACLILIVIADTSCESMAYLKQNPCWKANGILQWPLHSELFMAKVNPPRAHQRGVARRAVIAYLARSALTGASRRPGRTAAQARKSRVSPCAPPTGLSPKMCNLPIGPVSRSPAPLGDLAEPQLRRAQTI